MNEVPMANAGPTAPSVLLGPPPVQPNWILRLHADGRWEFNPVATKEDFQRMETADPRNATVIRAFAQRDRAMTLLLRLQDVTPENLNEYKREVAEFFGVRPDPAQGSLPLAGGDPFAV